MEFQAKVNEDVLIAASPEQRQELVDFIGSTINNGRNDITVSAGTGFEQLAEIRDRIKAQVDDDGPLTVSQRDMNIISGLANAWRMFGFDQTTPENYGNIPVSVETVEAISGVYDASMEV